MMKQLLFQTFDQRAEGCADADDGTVPVMVSSGGDVRIDRWMDGNGAGLLLFDRSLPLTASSGAEPAIAFVTVHAADGLCGNGRIEKGRYWSTAILCSAVGTSHVPDSVSCA